jgi:putative Mg2+ transporter-C (MgtC) family protein
MDLNIPLQEIVLRLTLAVVFGGIIGWERESKRKPAGLRTHMMVSLGAATFTLILLELYISALEGNPNSNVDPLRIIEAIVGGVGFLGAGSIIQSRGSVEGITTAAGIWVVGGVGLACGGGQYVIALVTVVFAFVILTILGYIESRIFDKQENGQ